ncbi:MAG: hypothetical protein KDD02_15125 [Phaeodactylibacter sp.]|nr:hypothetical protein [Phaeodactylibacter sp.]MCB9299480.1 hypothetical protein [Lewinellaceae bacterium]
MKEKETLKQLQLIFLALAAGQILFCLVVVYLAQTGTLSPSNLGLPLSFLLPTILFAAAGTAYFLSNRLSMEGKQLPTLSEKVQHYRNASILRLALVEGANILIVSFAMLEANLSFLAFFAIGLLIFAYFRPGLDKLAQSYELNAQELGALRD